MIMDLVVQATLLQNDRNSKNPFKKLMYNYRAKKIMKAIDNIEYSFKDLVETIELCNMMQMYEFDYNKVKYKVISKRYNSVRIVVELSFDEIIYMDFLLDSPDGNIDVIFNMGNKRYIFSIKFNDYIDTNSIIMNKLLGVRVQVMLKDFISYSTRKMIGRILE